MTNSVQNSFNLQVLYKTLKKHTNLKVNICPQVRVKLIKKKNLFEFVVQFLQKNMVAENSFLMDKATTILLECTASFLDQKTLDCTLVIKDTSNFHQLYIPLLDSLVSLSESTKSFISSRSRSSLKQIVKIPSNNITSAGCIVTDSFCLQLKKRIEE